ncbi:DUF91 domain-containing protein [Mariniphaga sediminis]|uniref:DUF91 domain-containing protein n=1 Tax=Mariniphaga sediminis TaxID=1628158 RepID=A0A399D4S0_9BACT|nr:endonuclease NucS domain-containing protein [Mariniphaga sediminis]RIH66178.1 DUF91 domain-containing protein [Mariniphaga sediminis]
MYKVNITDKSLTKLTPTNFSVHNLLERYDIQEWIEKTPEILGEELLIIAKELPTPSGSRLDLLAIDKHARLVVIELKRDDSGRDVDWQAIKYTSYCSNYLVDEIINHFAVYLKSDEDDARDRIDDFIDEELDILNHSQRIILVSKEFHSDVISSVLWLRDYGIDIECLRLVPFVDENNDLFVHPDKIIPLPEAKDYIVKKERKQKEIKKAQGSFDRGTVIENVTISLKRGLFRLDRYDTTTIIVFNLDEEREETAKPILREINNELDLGVPLLNSMGNNKNTRTLGKDIIAEIKAQQKEYKSDSQ